MLDQQRLNRFRRVNYPEHNGTTKDPDQRAASDDEPFLKETLLQTEGYTVRSFVRYWAHLSRI